MIQRNSSFSKVSLINASIKLGGALDGVFGGDCCKTDADPAKMIDFVVQAGTQYAAKQLLASVASHYTYTLLQNQCASVFDDCVECCRSWWFRCFGSGRWGGGRRTNRAECFWFYSRYSGGQLVVTFDPVSFAIAIAIMGITAMVEMRSKKKSWSQ